MQREREKNQSRGEERILDPCYPYYPFQVEITVEREGERERGRERRGDRGEKSGRVGYSMGHSGPDTVVSRGLDRTRLAVIWRR